MIENTRPVNEIIDVTIAERSARAPSGPPANRNGKVEDVSRDSSIAVNPSPKAAATTAHNIGSAQNRSFIPAMGTFKCHLLHRQPGGA